VPGPGPKALSLRPLAIASVRTIDNSAALRAGSLALATAGGPELPESALLDLADPLRA
jgi:hypothetical protein